PVPTRRSSDLARGNHPKIGDVSAGEVAPSQDPKQTFKTALHHEQRVSESIRELYRACSEAGDIDSNQLLNWFMSEQIEEEATVDEIVGRDRKSTRLNSSHVSI